VTTITTRVRRLERRTAGDALQEGSTLLPLLDGLSEDQTAWVAIVVRRQHIELVDPRPFAGPPPAVARFMAGLTRSETPDGGPAMAVGLAGNLQVRVRARSGGRRIDRSAPVTVAFLEAPDCDWWLWQRFLGATSDDGVPPEQQLAGRHGDPLPNGLGRWWSLGRRSGVRVTLQTETPAMPEVRTSPLIH